MAKSANVFARVEPELKNEAEAVLDQLGVPMSNAITMFLRQIVLKQGLPFEVSLPHRRPLVLSELTAEQWKAYATGKPPEKAQTLEPVKEVALPVLKRGSKGVAVKWIQLALGGLTVDGDFGWKTLNKVVDFQKAHGIEATGIVDNLTWANIVHYM